MPEITREELDRDIIKTHMQLLARGDHRRTSCAGELLSFAAHVAPTLSTREAYAGALRIVARGYRNE